jgi:molybdenum cofactor guanylyltransferase
VTDTRAAAGQTATLAILAGGAGSRMGRPKEELRIGDQPILSYLRERYQWSGPTILVTAPGRGRPPGVEGFDREVIDPVAGEGPLRGVITALEVTETDILVVASCDMPLVEGRQLLWVAQQLEHRPVAPLVMLRRAGGEIEPLPFAIRASALAAAHRHMTGGSRSLHSLAELEGAHVASVPQDWSASTWTNLNTPADLAAFFDHPGVS